MLLPEQEPPSSCSPLPLAFLLGWFVEMCRHLKMTAPPSFWQNDGGAISAREQNKQQKTRETGKIIRLRRSG
jgi:hypothetical protein